MVDRRPKPPEKVDKWKDVRETFRVLGLVFLGFLLVVVVGIGLVFGICSLLV